MIDDILKLKAQNLNLALKKAEVVTPSSKDWVLAKFEVDKLNNDFGQVIKNRTSESPESVKEEKRDKYKALIIKLSPINKHELFIHLTDKENVPVLARYVLCQKNGNRMYIRDLYKE